MPAALPTGPVVLVLVGLGVGHLVVMPSGGITALKDAEEIAESGVALASPNSVANPCYNSV